MTLFRFIAASAVCIVLAGVFWSGSARAGLPQAGVMRSSVTASAPAGPPKLSLKLKLKKGMVFRQRVFSEQVTTQNKRERSGQEKKIMQRRELMIDYSYLVEEVDTRGGAVIRVQYDTVHAMINDGNEINIFKSTDQGTYKARNSFPYAHLLGRGFRIKLTADATVQEVTGIDTLRSLLAEKIDWSDSTIGFGQRQGVDLIFGEQGLQFFFQQIFPFYPPKPVAVGDSWTRTSSSTIGVPLTFTATYKLVGIDGDIAIIEEVTVVGNNAAVDAGLQQGVRFHYDLSGRQIATMKISRETGWLMDSRTEREYSGQMQVYDDMATRLLYESPLTDRWIGQTRAWRH